MSQISEAQINKSIKKFIKRCEKHHNLSLTNEQKAWITRNPILTEFVDYFEGNKFFSTTKNVYAIPDGYIRLYLDGYYFNIPIEQYTNLIFHNTVVITPMLQPANIDNLDEILKNPTISRQARILVNSVIKAGNDKQLYNHEAAKNIIRALVKFFPRIGVIKKDYIANIMRIWKYDVLLNEIDFAEFM